MPLRGHKKHTTTVHFRETGANGQRPCMHRSGCQILQVRWWQGKFKGEKQVGSGEGRALRGEERVDPGSISTY